MCLLSLFTFFVPAALTAQVMQGPTTVRYNVHHDVSLPLSVMAKNPPKDAEEEKEAEAWKRVPLPPGLQPVDEDPVLQTHDLLTTPSPAVGLSFEGLGQGQYGFTVQAAPPDTNGAVGATQYVQWVNSKFIVFDKDDGREAPWAACRQHTLGKFWWRVPNQQQRRSRGPVRQIGEPMGHEPILGFHHCLICSALRCHRLQMRRAAWYRYSFSYGNTLFDDYPKMAVWPDAYYETFNMFQNGQTYVGRMFVRMTATRCWLGKPATQVCFQQTSVR